MGGFHLKPLKVIMTLDKYTHAAITFHSFSATVGTNYISNLFNIFEKRSDRKVKAIDLIDTCKRYRRWSRFKYT